MVPFHVVVIIYFIVKAFTVCIYKVYLLEIHIEVPFLIRFTCLHGFPADQCQLEEYQLLLLPISVKKTPTFILYVPAYVKNWTLAETSHSEKYTNDFIQIPIPFLDG